MADNTPIWDRICEIYSTVQKVPLGERAGALARECRGDTNLEREVSILLRLDSPPSEFMDGLKLPAPPPLSDSPSLMPGKILSGRYEVVGFLGAGGMGEVYEAADRELGERVAIKVLRWGPLPADVMVTRLRREIRLARRITHGNVCRVFDFARHELPNEETIHYYVMELLSGETLAARLARQGSQESQTALEIARQLAEGLKAAHLAGIVHRDFKPGNVMVTETPAGLRVAITDFGLATPVDASQAATSLGSTGLVLGTPGYVAPEQLYGGAVTPATDIYAYGIVLHELATGTHPRAPEAATAVLPKAWKWVIDRCMQLDPKSRYSSIAEAYGALLGAAPSPSTLSRRALIAGAGTTLLGGVSLAALFYRFYNQAAHLPAGALMVISPVANTTGESRFDSLTAALQASLAQSAHLNVWNRERLGEVMRAMRLGPGVRPDAKQWREIAFREKASAIVFSTVSRVGTGYVFSITTERLSADPTLPAGSEDRSFPAASPDGLFEALRDAGTWIRESAGEEASAIASHNRLPQDITSSNWQALELFNRAQELNATGKSGEAIPALRRAVELDQEFAMGFMHLGDILNAQRMSEEGFAHWRQAIKLARSQRLSEHEQLNIESRYAFETHDYGKAEAALTDWLRKFPNDALAHRLWSSCLLDLGRYPQAVSQAQIAQSKFGSSIFGVGIILRGLAASMRIDEMEVALAEMDRLSPSSWGPQFRGAIAALRGDYEAAERWFKKVTPVSRSTSVLAVLAGDRGDFDRVAGLLTAGIAQDRMAGEHGYASAKATQLAFIEGRRGNRSSARVWALEAVSEVNSPRNVTLCAATLARNGFLDDARKLLGSFPQQDLPLYDAYRWRIEGEILLAEGRNAEAVERMEKASKVSKALEAREYLARALDLAGEKERARKVYKDLTGTPWIIWNNPEFEWPGVRYLAQIYLQQQKEH